MQKVRVAAFAAISIVAIATPAIANHSWNGYHWKKPGSQVDAPVVTAISAAWNTYVDGSVADWNASGVIQSPYDTVTNSPATGVRPKTCKAIAGKILVCNERYGFNGWLGIASIWLSDGHISQGTTKLNDSYFSTGTYNSPSWRALVACQEVGHNYGLGHQDEDFGNADKVDGSGKQTCMDYTNTPTGNEHPNQHDYDQLTSIYNHTDAAAATDFGVRTPGQAMRPSTSNLGDGIPGDTPAQWGRAVHRDGLGRPDVFEMDLGGGNKKITHVFWTLETRRVEHED
jgi:hypothetical protein